MFELPDARFIGPWGSGNVPAPPTTDDDEELAETPPDVVELLGFDPLEIAEKGEMPAAPKSPEG